jgi:hypothetical protein
MFIIDKYINDREILIFLFTYFISMYVHEFGHVFSSIVFDKFIKLDGPMLLDTIYKKSDDNIEINILLYGILYGYIVILVYGYYYIKTYGKYDTIIYISIMYLIGCWYDIKRIIKILLYK